MFFLLVATAIIYLRAATNPHLNNIPLLLIADVVYVVDAGRVKENRQDEVNQMPTLVSLLDAGLNLCWNAGFTSFLR